MLSKGHILFLVRHQQLSDAFSSNFKTFFSIHFLMLLFLVEESILDSNQLRCRKELNNTGISKRPLMSSVSENKADNRMGGKREMLVL